MMHNLADLLYHYFVIPLFLIGGTVEIVSGVEPRSIFILMGIITIGIGFLLIWLDRNYDLDSCEIINDKNEVKN